MSSWCSCIVLFMCSHHTVTGVGWAGTPVWQAPRWCVRPHMWHEVGATCLRRMHGSCNLDHSHLFSQLLFLLMMLSTQDRRMVTCSLWPVLSTQCGTKGLSFVTADGVTADMWIQSIVRLTRACHRLHTLPLQRWCHQWLEAAWVTWPSRVLLSVFLDLSRWVFSPRSLVRAHICGCLLLHGWQCFPKC